MDSSARSADIRIPVILAAISLAFVIAVGVFLPDALLFAIFPMPLPLFLLFLSWNVEVAEDRQRAALRSLRAAPASTGG
jgi:hypothetical protein